MYFFYAQSDRINHNCRKNIDGLLNGYKVLYNYLENASINILIMRTLIPFIHYLYLLIHKTRLSPSSISLLVHINDREMNFALVHVHL